MSESFFGENIKEAIKVLRGMKMPKHNCKCQCKHERVEYCPKCQKVHCKDCPKEWPDLRQIVTPYYPYYEPYPYTHPQWTDSDGTSDIPCDTITLDGGANGFVTTSDYTDIITYN